VAVAEDARRGADRGVPRLACLGVRLTGGLPPVPRVTWQDRLTRKVISRLPNFEGNRIVANDPPGRILVAGDWHGNTDWAWQVISRAKELLGDEDQRIILQLGDFGIWPGPDGEDYLSEVAGALDEADAELWFVDGNHEDFTQLTTAPDWPADAKVVIRAGVNGTGICWLPRGYRWTWHGRTWLALGGGVSVDRVDRTEGVDWWPEEEITGEQERDVIAAGPADVMVCHDYPSGVVHSFPDRPDWWAHADIARSERHEERLRRIVDAVQPSHLMHGHLHRAYQRTCDFGYGPVEVTGLDYDEGDGANWAVLDTKSMTWEAG
jgi:hypothetical protein